MSRNFAVLFLMASGLVRAQDLMPLPAAMARTVGELAIDSRFAVVLKGYREPRLERAAARLVGRVVAQTGIPIAGRPGDGAAVTLIIECQGPGERVQTPREVESYTLEVTPQQAHVVAATPVGALRGIETFLQLVMPGKHGFAVPAVRIDDKPRFAWRGLMIDSSRHFIPLDVIERNLDAMAAVKLNVFHWHLSDNQGFRVESLRFPKLQEMGSDGLYYTQDQIRQVIEYASDRGIRVIPEFDMPGHATSWFVGYPELASGPGPYQIEREWGKFKSTMDPTREETYRFLDEFIGEMAALFPDEYFHIGGDEVNGRQWDENPQIQEFKRAHGIKTNQELQAYFNKRVLALVTKHGKKMVGWDEVLTPDLPKEIVVQSWRGPKSLAEAARQGFQGILSSGYYLDLMQSAAYHYGNDPLRGESASLSEEQQARILGGEACEWAELADRENIEARIWPRAAAIAERLWSPQGTKDVDSMYRRMEIESARLEADGLRHRSSGRIMFERIAGYRPAGIEALSTAVEPVKEYTRLDARQYTQSMPLNRMVDAVPPDSVAARRFSQAVSALLLGDQGRREEVLRAGVLWRDQYGQLQHAFADSFLAAELEPVSKDVAALGNAIVTAVDYLKSGKPAPKPWVEAQRRLLERAKAPREELLIVILDPVRKLVKAAAAGGK